jgi:tetratricopeptide (TPR) repeat protein
MDQYVCGGCELMKKLSVMVLGVVFFLGCGVAFAQIWEADFYIQRAEQYKNQNDWDNALEMYNSVLIREPENIKALNGRGVIYQKKGDYLKAKADFQYALSLNPTLGESKHNLDSVNERLKANALFTENPENEVYKDASKYLGAADYSVVGPTQPFVPPPAPVSAPIPTGGVVSLYDRTASSEGPPVSLYDRTVSTAPGTGGQGARPPGLTYTPYQNQAPGYSVPPPASAYSAPPVYVVPSAPARPSERLSQLPPAAPARVSAPPPQTRPVPAASAGVQSLRLDALAASLNNRGVELNAAGYYERAVLEYTDAIARNPHFAIAFNNRGVAYAKLGDYTRALEDFNQALRLNPFYFDAQANREYIKSRL